MILVADASALIALAACNSLPLLDAIFGAVWVPEAVYLDAFSDAGETAAMVLYKELQADYLLIDDKRGRKVAAINQIKTIGSLGVLLQAKRAGKVLYIAPLLSQIEASPVFISKALVKTVLELAGEADTPVRREA